MKITTVGKRFVEAAIKIEKQVQKVDLAIASTDVSLSGSLKVSAPQLLISHQLIDILDEFKTTYPNIDLNIIATTDAVNLNKREADISIRASNEPEGYLWGRRVLRQKCGFYLNKDYAKTIDKLSPLKCLNFMWWGDDVAPEIKAYYRNAIVTSKFDDMVAVHGAVVCGMGTARMPCFVGDQDDRLTRLPEIKLQPYSDIWVLTHPDLKKVPKINIFMQFVTKRLKHKETIFLGKNI